MVRAGTSLSRMRIHLLLVALVVGALAMLPVGADAAPRRILQKDEGDEAADDYAADEGDEAADDYAEYEEKTPPLKAAAPKEKGKGADEAEMDEKEPAGAAAGAKEKGKGDGEDDETEEDDAAAGPEKKMDKPPKGKGDGDDAAASKLAKDDEPDAGSDDEEDPAESDGDNNAAQAKLLKQADDFRTAVEADDGTMLVKEFRKWADKNLVQYENEANHPAEDLALVYRLLTEPLEDGSSALDDAFLLVEESTPPASGAGNTVDLVIDIRLPNLDADEYEKLSKEAADEEKPVDFTARLKELLAVMLDVFAEDPTMTSLSEETWDSVVAKNEAKDDVKVDTEVFDIKSFSSKATGSDKPKDMDGPNGDVAVEGDVLKTSTKGGGATGEDKDAQADKDPAMKEMKGEGAKDAGDQDPDMKGEGAKDAGAAKKEGMKAEGMKESGGDPEDAEDEDGAEPDEDDEEDEPVKKSGKDDGAMKAKKGGGKDDGEK